MSEATPKFDVGGLMSEVTSDFPLPHSYFFWLPTSDFGREFHISHKSNPFPPVKVSFIRASTSFAFISPVVRFTYNVWFE